MYINLYNPFNNIMMQLPLLALLHSEKVEIEVASPRSHSLKIAKIIWTYMVGL